ncbi:hypothetical protein FOL47_010679 [Perkinsus chesapeaki]|uniref:Uncharacterized protein n=1 Tax=Perkinsus chesapeaki TaxID=330153 RepID=A0A7J6MP08_PERCH|nr:hypothetical protein FOL47_010679 [Perkinsus chesapeaki]
MVHDADQPPVFTLNCPMVEFILDIDIEPNYIFATSDVVYGLFACPDAIQLRALNPLGEAKTLAKTKENRATFYYNADISHLYALYDDDGPSLLDYDVKGNKVNEVYKIPLLSKLGVWPIKMVAMKDEVFFVVDWHEEIEVFHVNLATPEELIGICDIYISSRHLVFHLAPLPRETPAVRLFYSDQKNYGFAATTLERWTPKYPFVAQPWRSKCRSFSELHPIVGSDFGRYGDEGTSILLDCTSDNIPAREDCGQLDSAGDLFDSLAASDGNGKVYFLRGRRYRDPRSARVPDESIRLVKAYTYIRNIDN